MPASSRTAIPGLVQSAVQAALPYSVLPVGNNTQAINGQAIANAITAGVNAGLAPVIASCFNLADDDMSSGTKLLASGQALASNIAVPSASSITPPPVSATGSLGTQTQYARADHTHGSDIQRKRVQLGTGGTYTWVFDTPFATGTVPAVGAIAENTGSQPVDINLAGPPTNVSVTFKGFQAGMVTVATLGSAVSVFTAAAAGIWIHIWAGQST